MLHDLYLYDWHDGETARKKLSLDRPDITCDNAVKPFDIPEKSRRLYAVICGHEHY